VAPSWPAPPNGRIIPHPAQLCQPFRVQSRPGCQPPPVMISCAADLPPQSIMTVARQQQKYSARESRCSRQQKKADNRNRLAPEYGGCPLVNPPSSTACTLHAPLHAPHCMHWHAAGSLAAGGSPQGFSYRISSQHARCVHAAAPPPRPQLAIMGSLAG
jgi:hypothetical protein